MDNQTDISVNESKPKPHGCLIACLITFAALILHIAAIPFLIEIVDHIPRTKDTQTNTGPTKIITRVDSSTKLNVNLNTQNILLRDMGYTFDAVLKDNNNKKICSVDFSLSNDGKSMCESNWKVDWNDESVIVTIMGEEQSDALYTLYYNGDVSN